MSVKAAHDDSTRIRKFTAMLAAWPRRSPRLLMAPPKKNTLYACCRLYHDKMIINPKDDLPDDILLLIFEYLTKAKDIAAIRNVCQSWRKVVDRTATIWRSLVFDLPKCPSSASEAESWYRKAADYGNSQAQFLLALLYTYGYRGNERRNNQSLAHSPF